MAYDFSQINDLDLNNLGSWPKEIKIGFVVIISILTLFLGNYFFIGDALDDLENKQQEELKLRDSYRIKHAIAANLDVYREQMAQMEIQLATMLKKLPASHETPGLLDDITFVGTAAGLSIIRINWESEVEKEFYTELPLRIEVIGDFHDFGNFVSDVAALPRIVSLHDFVIKRTADTKLRLDILAKTYRYKGE